MNSRSEVSFQRLANRLRDGWTELVDRLLPASCSACGREGHWWCSGELPWPQCFWCQRSHHPEGHRLGCPKRSLPLIYLGGFKDNPSLRSRLHQWKYSGLWALSTDWGRALAERLLGMNLTELPLVPIPIHRRRQLSRGFDQTLRLAEDIAKHTGQALVKDVLTKNRPTPPQVQRANRDERFLNLADSFSARDRESEETQALILVDDVVTSGATMTAARKVLHEAGWRVRAIVAVATDR